MNNVFKFFIFTPVVLYCLLVVAIMVAGLHTAFTGQNGSSYFVLSGLALIPPIVIGVATLSVVYKTEDEEDLAE